MGNLTLKKVLQMSDKEVDEYNSVRYSPCECWAYFWKLRDKGFEENEILNFPFFVGNR